MSIHYRTRILDDLTQAGRERWDELAAAAGAADHPFLSFDFLHALHSTGCAEPRTGWSPEFLTLWDGKQLAAAAPLYRKAHSYGEYVFDWAWADAYQRNGFDYYPKLLDAIPFSPIPGPRLLARDDDARAALLSALLEHATASEVSSLHVLFPTEPEAQSL
jgi:predicted N-acyltransferase